MPSLWLCGEHVFNRTHGRVTGESRRVSPLCETPPRPSHAGTARSSFRSQVVPSGWMCSWCLLLSHLPLCRRRCTADSSLPRPSALCLPSLPALLCTPFRQCIPLLPAMPPGPSGNASLSSSQCPLAPAMALQCALANALSPFPIGHTDQSERAAQQMTVVDC